jgi:hypothetical protein
MGLEILLGVLLVAVVVMGGISVKTGNITIVIGSNRRK